MDSRFLNQNNNEAYASLHNSPNVSVSSGESLHNTEISIPTPQFRSAPTQITSCPLCEKRPLAGQLNCLVCIFFL